MSTELVKILSDLQTLIGAWQAKDVAIEEEFNGKLETLATALMAEVEKVKAAKAEAK